MRPLIIGMLVGLMLVVGCVPRQHTAYKPWNAPEPGFKMVIIVDATDDFMSQMGAKGDCFEFICYAVEKYFHARSGTNDELVIAQITDDHRKTVIYDGSPRKLLQKFPNEEAFRQFLTGRRSNGSGSDCYACIDRALRIHLMDQGIKDGVKQSVCLVCSNMKDTKGDKEMEQRLLDRFMEYLTMGGAMGFYYMDEEAMIHWDELFKSRGSGFVTMELDANGRPPLPNVED